MGARSLVNESDHRTSLWHHRQSPLFDRTSDCGIRREGGSRKDLAFDFFCPFYCPVSFIPFICLNCFIRPICLIGPIYLVCIILFVSSILFVQFFLDKLRNVQPIENRISQLFEPVKGCLFDYGLGYVIDIYYSSLYAANSSLISSRLLQRTG